MPADTPAPNPGPTPTGYQRTTGGKGFKWQPPTAEHLSKLLPQYEIECILGHGGMGAVYKGKQKSLDRLVAIKILPPELDDEDASYVDRFKNEAKVMAKFMHPAIVGVFDFGETSEGQLYIVMEYVDGTDVQKMIQSQGRLPPEHALAITAHVCDALRYAHEHGVIHRDIKPANILINMEGAVKVADFGLAKAEEAGASGLTKTGMAMGTPDYVAPEALIMGVNVDGRADLYAIGVMLYNMLTGNVPRGAFKPASIMIREIDPRFDAIVQKAMQMDREERYQSAAEIRQDLDVILTTPLVQAGGQSSAAIPKASIAQKPVAKGPQKPMGKSANVPVRQGAAAEAKPNHQSEIVNPKSKAPLFIGIGGVAAIAVGAFVMMGGKKDAGRAAGPPAAASVSSSSTSPAAPIKVREEPKPAPKPISSSPSLPVSKSSEPQFPPGKWVKVFQPGGYIPQDARWENGWLEIPAVRGVPGSEGKNTGVRMTLNDVTGFSSNGFAAAMNIRHQNTDCNYILRVNPKGLVELIYQPDDKAPKHALKVRRLFDKQLPLPIKQPLTLELAGIGKRLFIRAQNELLGMVEDDALDHGQVRVGAWNPTRDIEVINLDGLSEAEAIKILGVDEKGNDLRQPAAIASTSPAPVVSVSKSPPLPVSPSSDKFPPGEWVKVFTKFEDLPDGIRKPDSGFTFEDGWISLRSGVDKSLSLTDPVGFKRVGMRLRASKANSQTGLMFKSSPCYFRTIVNPGKMALSTQGMSGRRDQGFGSVLLPSGPSETIDIEAYVLGQSWVARSENKMLEAKIPADLVAEDLRPSIYFGNSGGRATELEVINLDGIPEAEVLRIIGIDEKGNDTRAAALAEEKKATEQAKVVDAMAAIPELKALNEQFVKLQAERVTVPFEADVAKLNSGYLGGLDREIEKEKKAGHLDGVLVLEAEKKLIQGVMASSHQASDDRRLEAVAPCPIPAEDDDATPANLKGLRKIYRDAFAKLEATRTANLKLLTDPLSIRLKQLESTLTQANRIDHAKTVREYREALTSGTAAVPSGTATAPAIPTTTPPTNTALPAVKYPKGDDRKAAEWVLKLGGKVTIREGVKETTLTTQDTLPKGKFDLVDVNLSFSAPGQLKSPFENLDALAGLESLEVLGTKHMPLEDRHMSMLASLPKLTSLSISDAMLTDDFCRHLIGTKTLERLSLFNFKSFSGTGLESVAPESLKALYFSDCNVTDASLALLRRFKQLSELNLVNLPITDSAMSMLNELRELTHLKVMMSSGNSSVMKVTLEGLEKLKSLKKLSKLGWTFTPGDMLQEVSVIARVFPELASLETTSLPFSAEDIAAFAACRKLSSLSLVGPGANDAAAQGLLRLPSLEELYMKTGVKITDAGLSALAAHKSLHTIVCNDAPDITDAGLLSLAKLKSLQRLEVTKCAKTTTAGIEDFKKARPDVSVKR